MAQTADYKFFKSLNCNAFDLTPKILDELHLALEHVENPINQTMQVISELHGPFSGSSQELGDFIQSLSGKLGKFESALKKMQSNVKTQIAKVKDAVSKVESSVNLINQITSSEMSTSMLRAFIGQAQKLNPLVNDLIQREIEKFPMFQQISESIGMFYNIHISKVMIDPEKVLNGNTGYKSDDTNMVLRKDNFKKIFRPISEMIEQSNNLTESLIHRCQPITDLTNYIKNYSESSSKCHGYSNCQDVFHYKRAVAAKDGALVKVISHLGDRVRLLNSIFPVTVSLDYGTQTQEIQTEHGPVMIDENGRSFSENTNNASKDNLNSIGSSLLKQSYKS